MNKDIDDIYTDKEKIELILLSAKLDIDYYKNIKDVLKFEFRYYSVADKLNNNRFIDLFNSVKDRDVLLELSKIFRFYQYLSDDNYVYGHNINKNFEKAYNNIVMSSDCLKFLFSDKDLKKNIGHALSLMFLNMEYKNELNQNELKTKIPLKNIQSLDKNFIYFLMSHDIESIKMLKEEFPVIRNMINYQMVRDNHILNSTSLIADVFHDYGKEFLDFDNINKYIERCDAIYDEENKKKFIEKFITSIYRYYLDTVLKNDISDERINNENIFKTLKFFKSLKWPSTMLIDETYDILIKRSANLQLENVKKRTLQINNENKFINLILDKDEKIYRFHLFFENIAMLAYAIKYEKSKSKDYKENQYDEDSREMYQILFSKIEEEQITFKDVQEYFNLRKKGVFKVLGRAITEDLLETVFIELEKRELSIGIKNESKLKIKKI